MNTQEKSLTLPLSREEHHLLLEAVRNQREFILECGYLPENVDKSIEVAKKVELAVNGEDS